jgi:tryptophan synthase alpha chain
VGFGIKDAASAGAVAGVADGAVVGSALIDTMAQTIANGSSEELATDNAISLLKSIRNGVDNVPTGV